VTDLALPEGSVIEPDQVPGTMACAQAGAGRFIAMSERKMLARMDRMVTSLLVCGRQLPLHRKLRATRSPAQE